MQCDLGICKDHRLNMQDCETLYATCDPTGATALRAPPKKLLSLLNPFNTTVEVEVCAAPDFLGVRSYHPDTTGAGSKRAVVRTELNVSSAEFDMYSFKGRGLLEQQQQEQLENADDAAAASELVVSVKELKAMLHFCEAVDIDALVHLHDGGLPASFSAESNTFSVDLIMATMTVKATAPLLPPPPSRPAQQQRMRHRAHTAARSSTTARAAAAAEHDDSADDDAEQQQQQYEDTDEQQQQQPPTPSGFADEPFGPASNDKQKGDDREQQHNGQRSMHSGSAAGGSADASLQAQNGSRSASQAYSQQQQQQQQRQQQQQQQQQPNGCSGGSSSSQRRRHAAAEQQLSGGTTPSQHSNGEHAGVVAGFAPTQVHELAPDRLSAVDVDADEQETFDPHAAADAAADDDEESNSLFFPSLANKGGNRRFDEYNDSRADSGAADSQSQAGNDSTTSAAAAAAAAGAADYNGISSMQQHSGTEFFTGNSSGRSGGQQQQQRQRQHQLPTPMLAMHDRHAQAAPESTMSKGYIGSGIKTGVSAVDETPDVDRGDALSRKRKPAQQQLGDSDEEGNYRL
jgi:Rad9